MSAILYLRFSVGEQSEGDSERRQRSLAERWCNEHKQTLAKIYADRGISGGKGSNERKGLASLLDDLERSPAPEFLLVEDCDRLSRQLPLEASKLIERILNNGVTIISLGDGQHLTKDNFQTTQVWLIFQLKSSLANEERQKRIMRGREAWNEKRRNAGKEIYTRKAPAWLTLKDGKFVPIPRNVRIVRELFGMARDGVGIVTMIRLLNERGEESFMPKRDWNKATIYNVLTNPGVTGRFQPQTSLVRRGDDGREKKVRIPDGPEIANYFPRIIDDRLFGDVQAKLKQRNKYKGTTFNRQPSNSNLFAGIIKCKACGASMIHLVRSRYGYSYLVCSSAHKHKGCSYKVVNTHVVETCFHLFLESDNVFRTFQQPAARAAGLEARYSDVAKQIKKYSALIEGLDHPPRTLAKKLVDLETEQDSLTRELKVAAAEDRQLAIVPDLFDEFTESMAENLCTPLGRVKIMSMLKDLVERIVVDPQERRMWVTWKGVSKSEGLEWSADKQWYWRIGKAREKFVIPPARTNSQISSKVK